MSETLEEFAARLKRLADGEMQKRLAREAVRAALYGEGRVKEYMTTRLSVRTGTLRRSGKGEVRTGGRVLAGGGGVLVGDSLDVVISAGSQRGGTPLTYAAAQERGAIVRPRNGRYLAIPLSGGPAVTPAGAPRYTSARKAPGLVPWRSKSGRLFLVKFSRSGPKPWYVLHPGPIRIKPKHFVRDAARDTEAYLIPRLERLFTEALSQP